MKTVVNSLLASVSFAALLATPTLNAQNYGTDILHWDNRTLMTGTLEPEAAGVVIVTQKTQGKSDQQKLQVDLSGLDTNKVYALEALLGDSTNFTDVAVITPDAKGEASVLLQNKNNGNGKSKGKGKGNGKNNDLPSALNPVVAISGLALFYTNTEPVLTADLGNPYFLQYQIKRNLSTNGITALLQIHVTTQQTQFRLTASGLAATNSYSLVLNNAIQQAVTTDSSGKLSITSLSPNPTNILDVHSLALWDAGSNTLFSTQLP